MTDNLYDILKRMERVRNGLYGDQHQKFEAYLAAHILTNPHPPKRTNQCHHSNRRPITAPPPAAALTDP